MFLGYVCMVDPLTDDTSQESGGCQTMRWPGWALVPESRPAASHRPCALSLRSPCHRTSGLRWCTSRGFCSHHPCSNGKPHRYMVPEVEVFLHLSTARALQFLNSLPGSEWWECLSPALTKPLQSPKALYQVPGPGNHSNKVMANATVRSNFHPPCLPPPGLFQASLKCKWFHKMLFKESHQVFSLFLVSLLKFASFFQAL